MINEHLVLILKYKSRERISCVDRASISVHASTFILERVCSIWQKSAIMDHNNCII